MIYKIESKEHDMVFPDPSYAPADYPLAVGGDLTPERLYFAYSNGIFPWFSEEDPIMWWSPDPRTLLYPKKMHVSKKLAKKIRKNEYNIKFNSCFKDVISSCSKIPRKDQDGTWITDEMIDAYIKLHNTGIAHSVEVFRGNELVGGLYGVSIGGMFAGESMFSKEPDTSKIALHALCQLSNKCEFDFIDCQMETDHLISLGAKSVMRKVFLNSLKDTVVKKKNSISAFLMNLKKDQVHQS